MMKLRVDLCVLAFISFLLIQFGGSSGSPTTKEAYVTLLYGDEFLLGVRVLGKSIRDTGAKRDMVVLVSDGVSEYSKKLLKADGWIVEKISLLANPNEVHPARFWGVYTKLKIFNMTAYEKVVYLDADTIVVKSIEDLFKCSKFCANLKHSERLNSGVLVVEPSEALFNDMMSKVSTLASYTGGDQGFLNSYYPDFPNAHVFDPSIPLEVLKSRPSPKMERLSTLYNADVGLYMLANKWMVDESALHVIHYTLGPLKPWDWWTSWLVKPVDVWQSIRVRVEETLPGTGGGKNPKDEFIVKFLFILPICAIIFCAYRAIFQTREFLGSMCRSSICNQIRHVYHKIKSCGTHGYTGVSTLSALNSNHQLSNGAKSIVPSPLGGLSIVVCFGAVVLSLGISFAIVPRQVMPWTGLLLMYEWTFTIFVLLYGGFLHLIYRYGKSMGMQAGILSSDPESALYDSGKGHQRQAASCDATTWFYGLGMVSLAIAIPSLPYAFGVTALFVRLGLMVAVSIVLASFVTYASEHLAIRWFLRGLEDRDTTRTRSLCLLC